VARLDGEWGNLRCLEQALLGQVTATRARGKATGTVELRVVEKR
jgi:hypothetical protein